MAQSVLKVGIGLIPVLTSFRDVAGHLENAVRRAAFRIRIHIHRLGRFAAVATMPAQIVIVPLVAPGEQPGIRPARGPLPLDFGWHSQFGPAAVCRRAKPSHVVRWMPFKTGFDAVRFPFPLGFNDVSHGVSPKSEERGVWMRFRKKPGELFVSHNEDAYVCSTAFAAETVLPVGQVCSWCAFSGP